MPQDSYELPSIYSSSGKTYVPAHEQHVRSPSQQDMIPIIHKDMPYNPVQSMRDYEEEEEQEEGYPVSTNNNTSQDQDRWLAWLLLGASFSMLFFTLVPVVANLPDVVPSWFSGDALWRLFDPLFTLPLNLFIMTRASSIMNGKARYWGNWSEQTVGWLFWSLGAALFVQGHGLHTASAMFKHPVQDFNLAHPDIVDQYPVLQQIYSYMRDLWEHIIAHYMYAFGGMVMSWAQLFAFRNQVHGPLTIGTKIVFALGSLVYGLLLAGIAIEFPDGLYVGLVYSIVIGLICICLMVFKPNGLSKGGGILTMGRRMVLQFYLGACVVGLIIVIIWIGIYGFQNRLAAGVAT
ncbi:uncharacterized protein BX664DRAFT_332283 [Halteromyces radiatus]|uniref:uncharacterized protein n=1 Tax=Halteromyces radiatus TaxID=101107 RepID=UPI00221F0E5E|nr:uncharacterized protein BX664DRAFT_332283 [Halteromyces radiatus]KAI8089140.1 hypothetical protein BX664DRAFT_332283 [Halteromyces radiatus]